MTLLPRKITARLTAANRWSGPKTTIRHGQPVSDNESGRDTAKSDPPARKDVETSSRPPARKDVETSSRPPARKQLTPDEKFAFYKKIVSAGNQNGEFKLKLPIVRNDSKIRLEADRIAGNKATFKQVKGIIAPGCPGDVCR